MKPYWEQMKLEQDIYEMQNAPTPAYDFAAAQDKFDSIVDLYCESPSVSAAQLVDYAGGTNHAAAIRFALKLAAKVMQEPSHTMLDAAIKSYNQNGQFALQSHFTAMISQACKEVENAE